MPEDNRAHTRRILLLSRLFPKASDPRHGIFALRQAERLREAGYDIEVISPVPFIPQVLTHIPRWRRYRNQTAPCEVSGFNVHRPAYFRPPGRWFIGREGKAMWRGIRSTVERLASAKPFDLVYAWDFKVDVAAGCAAARHLGVPCAGLAIGGDLNVDVRHNPGALRAITQSLMDCDGIACVSQALCRRVAALTRGQRSAVYITTGADMSRFQPAEEPERRRIRHELGWPEDAIVILSVGYLLRAKGIYELVDAFDRVAQSHPRAMLVYLGEGSERPMLEQRAARSPFAERIRVVGHVHREEAPSCFRAADVLALPSYHEGMPNVVLEAMGAGLPILATRVGGVPEAVPDERFGLLVPPQDREALGGALARLLADEATRKAMGAECRKRALEHYDIDRINERVRAFLEETVRQGRRTPDPPVRSLAMMVDITSNSPFYTEGLSRGLCPHLEVICRAGTYLRQPNLYDECGLREDLMSWVSRLLTRWPRLDNRGLVRDIIRTFGYLTSWMQIISEGLRRRIPVIHVQWCKVPVIDICMFALLRALRFRVVYTVHDAMPHSDRRWSSRVKYGRLYRLANALVVLSARVGRDLEEWVLPGASRKTHVIEHGLLYPKTPSPTRAEARRRLELDENKEVLLFFGAILPYKGLADLIDAFGIAGRTRPELTLLIAGELREPFETYRNQIDKLGVTDRVKSYPWFVDEEFKVSLYAAADIAVLPHRDPSQSAMGCEALALGKPLIATDRGGLPDLVEHGRTGYVVPAEDPPTMAEAILAFFGQSRERQRAMADASRQFGLDRFDWQVIGRKHVELYRSLAGENGKPAHRTPKPADCNP